MQHATSLDQYRLLGRSGLRVSPLALGTMTFGKEWGWGADETDATRIFDAYVERGGNFIDTAVNYTNGASERMLGRLIADKRERVVVATKFTMARDPGNINSGGNHRLNLMRSVETSLRQLATDRIASAQPPQRDQPVHRRVVDTQHNRWRCAPPQRLHSSAVFAHT